MYKYILVYIFIGLMLDACWEENKNSVKFYGNVDVRTVSLAFEVPGKIESINFEEG